jgi:hypothetical protein
MVNGARGSNRTANRTAAVVKSLDPGLVERRAVS